MTQPVHASEPLRKVVVTGANGHLGRALLTALSGRPSYQTRALVRSERASRQLLGTRTDADVCVVDSLDAVRLGEALAGYDAVVHLIGILKESARSRYRDAHENSARALASAARDAGCHQVVYASILGADRRSPNPCLASKARAETLLGEPPLMTTVLRLPMVIGPDEPATLALRARARSFLVPLLGGGHSLDQPIDVRDVLAAICACLERPPESGRILELAGPEALPYRDLVRRAAALWGRRPGVVAIPVGAASIAARVAERILANPPLTPAMLDVLARDDAIDPAPACEALGVELTPLAETLQRWVGPSGGD